jgi:hypothetical protein
VGRERGEGGEAGEQQMRAPGNPYSSFSSSSPSLCIRRGFDKKFCFWQCRTIFKFENTKYDSFIFRQQHEASTKPKVINDTGILISPIETILITFEASIDSECKPWAKKL